MSSAASPPRLDTGGDLEDSLVRPGKRRELEDGRDHHLQVDSNQLVVGETERLLDNISKK